MKSFKLAIFNRPAPMQMVIRELDDVLDAVWVWEVANHGRPETQFKGRVLFEAVMELQKMLIEEDR